MKLLRLLAVALMAITACAPTEAPEGTLSVTREPSPGKPSAPLEEASPVPQAEPPELVAVVETRPPPDQQRIFPVGPGGPVTEPRLIERGPFSPEKLIGRKVSSLPSLILVAKMVVQADGSVDNLELIRGIDPEIDRDFLESIATARFEPARLKGTPVPVEYGMTLKVEVR